MVQMKGEKLIIYSNNSLRCGNLKIPSYRWKEF